MHQFYYSLSNPKFSTALKYSDIRLVFKNDDKTVKVVFRAIIILPTCRYKAKGRISKRMFQENKARQITGVRNIRFSGNLVRFVFLKHPF